MLSSTGTSSFFVFTDTAATEIYTLSLHPALPISSPRHCRAGGPSLLDPQILLCGRDPTPGIVSVVAGREGRVRVWRDRKSTRLNSSHANISYAAFCLKKQYISPTVPVNDTFSPPI